MNKNKTLVRYLVFTIVSGIIAIGAFVSLFLSGIFIVIERTPFFRASMAVIAIVFGASSIMFSRAWIEHRHFIEQLYLENTYTLGQESPFYNFDAFKNKASKMSRRRILRKYRRFIIAFTSSSEKITSNSFHNDMISSLNFATASYLSELFDGRGKYAKRFNVYGFNRGIFLMFIFVDNEKDVPELISLISTNIYRIIKERNLKVYVQPFFGIKEMEEGENIVSAIEDSFIARNVSESNFETYTFFNPSFKRESTNEDISDIEDALRNEEFVVYYQPKYSLKEKKFISCEALARWDSPKYGFLTPAMFIAKAEHAGLISAIDDYIFEKTLRDISEQLRRGRRVLPVSVNFSIFEFYSQGFIDHVLNLLHKYNVPTHLVEIEITETTSQANQFLSISIIKKLKEIGIRVLMDDFGIGYSGLDNLRKIPFDAIKIDKSFADLICEEEKTRSIVKLITELGHMNNIEVIIEGVDKKEQVDILRRMHLDTIQGFYYSKPLSLEKYDEFLKDNPFEKKEEKK